MQHKIIDRRYKIVKKVGTGATGTVYKVHDLKDKKILALKILSKETLSSKTVQHFKREFKLLARLHHPHLCSVYDFGTLRDGRNYFTMEYIDGENIFQASQHKTYQDLYPWIVQLCRVLEYIHAKGLLHYDIKPGNVLVARGKEFRPEATRILAGQGAEGNKKRYAQSSMLQVKLMDFGLAGEERLGSGTLIKGTFPYMAPEVLKGLAVDHRADLYSLGVLLYGIFTRKALQVGKKTSFATLLNQQRKLVSELPSKIVTDMPRRLERLIMRLLSCEPTGRFDRANEVIKEINKLSCSKFAVETEKTIEGYLLSSKFVGREKEMSLLQSLYEKVRKGKGKVILVTGNAGIGKSRLLKEFRIFTQLKRSHCIISYTYKDNIRPLEPFYDIFSELINYVGDKSSLARSRELKLSLAVLFKIFPDLSNGHLRKNLPKLISLDPNAEKLRTFEALSALIGYCASTLGELVILVEDLHWADDLSIQFLEYLSRNIVEHNIFLCGTSREQELKENKAFQKMISNLKNEEYFNQIELSPLEFRSLYSFLDSTITPGSNSPELVRYLLKKSGGNPFFVEEIMRTLLRKKGVSIGEKIELEYLQKISIPETIEDIVLRRVKDLDSSSQKIVKFGVILLKDFGYNLMKRLTGLEDTELSRAFWELKRRQVLIEEDNRYRFYHTALRDALSRRLGDRERRDLNYQIGKILEKINRGKLNKVIEDLAYYFIKARDRKKGVSYGLRAAKKSSDKYAHEQAIRFYKGVLGLSSNKDSKLRFEILYKMAQVEVMISYYDDAIKHFQRALSLKSGTIDKKIKAYIRIINVYARKGEYNKTLHIYRRGIRLLKKMESGRSKRLLEASINVKMCRAYQIIGDYQNADKFNFDDLKSLKGLKEKDAIRLQASIYSTLGVIESIKGEYSKIDYDKVIFYYREAYRFYKKIEAEAEIAVVLGNFGICYYLKFEFQKAYRYHQKSLQIEEKIGNQYGLSNTLYNLSLIFIKKGCYLKTMDCCQKALSISKKTGNHSLTCASLLVLGECFSNLCNYKKAKEHFEKSLKISHAIDWKEQKIYSINAIGMIHQSTGNYTRALRLYRRALKISKDIAHQHGIALLFLSSCSVFIEIGEFSNVKRYIEDTLKIATAIGRRDIEIKCYIHLCRAYLILKDYVTAIDYYKKGIKFTEKVGLRQQLLQFFLSASHIHYHEKKYGKGVKIANKAIKMAKEMGTKDLYAEALMMRAKNGIELGVLSKIEAIKILDEAKKIAEEIGCPEILWKIYFEYGRFFQGHKQYLKALDYYDKCNDIFGDVSSKIKNKGYKKSYLNRPDRKLVDTAIKEIERLHG